MSESDTAFLEFKFNTDDCRSDDNKISSLLEGFVKFCNSKIGGF